MMYGIRLKKSLTSKRKYKPLNGADSFTRIIMFSGEPGPVKSSPTKPSRNIPEKTEDTKIFRRSLRDSSREIKDAKNDSSNLDSSLDFDNEVVTLQ